MTPAEARVSYGACPLCDCEEFAEEKLADCRHHAVYNPELPPEMRWMKCRACGHVFTAGYFSAKALEILLSDVQANQRPGFDLHGTRLVSARIVHRVCSVRGGAGGRWLDVGFGNGALLTTAEEYGFEVVGLDLRKENVELMRLHGIDAHVLDLTAYVPEQPFDVVSMADVLEHMPYPRPALTHANRIIADEGLLFLSMPNSDCYVWRQLDEFGENPFWGELEHYHNFGRKRLYALLEDFGFRPVHYGVSERYYICMEVIARKVRNLDAP